MRLLIIYGVLIGTPNDILQEFSVSSTGYALIAKKLLSNYCRKLAGFFVFYGKYSYYKRIF